MQEANRIAGGRLSKQKSVGAESIRRLRKVTIWFIFWQLGEFWSLQAMSGDEIFF